MNVGKTLFAQVNGCQRAGLGELDLPTLAASEYPVEHATVRVDSFALSRPEPFVLPSSAGIARGAR